MHRRGFLGLLGSSVAAAPFVGQAVALRADPVTGALTIEDKKIVVEPIPIERAFEYLVIPVDALLSLTPRFRRDSINITTLDDSAPEYRATMDKRPAEIDMTIRADAELSDHIRDTVLNHFAKRGANARR